MDISMKKSFLFVVLLMSLLVITGCSKNIKSINTEEVSVNTILAKTNGVLQVATVENFDKPYYDLKELKEFITKEVELYNKNAGDNKVKIDAVEQRDNKVIMLLTYTGMDQYTAFNKVTAAYFNGGIANLKMKLPATLVNASNESLTGTQEVIQNKGYKVLVLNEPYEIIVDGNVKYYSESAKLLEDNKVLGAAEEMTVVVFK